MKFKKIYNPGYERVFYQVTSEDIKKDANALDVAHEYAEYLLDAGKDYQRTTFAPCGYLHGTGYQTFMLLHLDKVELEKAVKAKFEFENENYGEYHLSDEPDFDFKSSEWLNYTLGGYLKNNSRSPAEIERTNLIAERNMR